MTRRDRHGRLYGGVDPDFAEHYLSVRLREVDAIARQVYVDRNAPGAPARLRARLRAEMRPELRLALKHARTARAALLAGREAAFEAARARAWLALQTAQTIFRQPHMERASKADAGGHRGGRPSKADQAAEWARRYDLMVTTRRSLNAQERYEQIASEDLGTDTKWRTVRDAISRHRKRGR